MQLPPETHDALEQAAGRYFDSRRTRVDRFVRENFGLRGTLRLHRHALGWDLLRAPLNVTLSPVYLTSRIAGLFLRVVGLGRAGRWLDTRRVFLPTALGVEIERKVVCELLELPWSDDDHPSRRDALAEAVLRSPELTELIVQHSGADGLARLRSQIGNTMGEYTGSRSAVAEMTTAIGTLGTGAIAFQSLTPGVVSFAPMLSAILAHQVAISAFPLGSAIGSLWYGVFPAQASPVLIGGLVALLILGAALFATFAGIVADPIQARLGIHQRRLHRLIASLEQGFAGDTKAAFKAREHYLARLFDIADASLTAMRSFRG
ncbi:DUF6635 family protein [Qingshengfaniella alkalisoli]|uniref:Uncharacterized protein n=1 Tax=Qingshengfaniella alkalisoli TaxID=2599296 RepID=A0A5B8J390_9RHOB|nr:DUF6635 family protein [Qingshengfaniella alkalisoli]QDY71551.1 hypothetical protein FPZ52_17920 [Qingshengfaniella alkalisoli]